MKLICQLLLLVISSISCAQVVEQLDNQQGTLGNANYSFLEASDGSIWLYSENGIVRFYNNRYTHFTHKNGLAQDDVWKLFEDSKGRLWPGNYANQIQYIQNNTVKDVEILDETEHGFYVGEHNDTIHINVFEDKAFKCRRYLAPDGSIGNYKYKGFEDYEVYTRNDEFGFLILVKNEEFTLYSTKYKTLKPADIYFSIQHQVLMDSDNILKDLGSLYQLEERNNDIAFQKIEDLNDVFNNSNLSYINRSNCIRYSVNGYHHIYKDLITGTKDEELEAIINKYFGNKELISVLVDSQMNLWSVDFARKAYFVDNLYLFREKVELASNFPDDQVRDIIALDDQNIMYYTNRFNVFVYNHALKKSRLVIESKYVNSIRSVENYGNNIFIRSATDLLRIPIDKLLAHYQLDTPYTPEYKIDPETVALHIAIIDSNQALMGDGIIVDFKKMSSTKAYFKTQRITKYGYQVDYGDGTALFIKNDEIIAFNHHDKSKKYELSPGKIKLAQINKDKILVFTYDQHLFTYSLETGKLLRKQALPFLVNSLSIHGDQYYLATNRGIVIGEIANDIFKIKQNSKLGLNGEISLRKVEFAKELYVISNGDLFRTKDRIFNHSPSKFNFHLWLDDKVQVKQNAEINLESIHTLQIRALLPEYFNRKETFFRYRIITNQEQGEWIYFTGDHSIPLKNLAVGTMTIELQNSYNPLSGYTNTRTLHFRLTEPFYRTTWFILLMLLLFITLLGVFYLAIRLRMKKLSKRDLRLLELQYQSTSSQLNPHFIFNAMNSIQSLVFNNEKIAANNYISTFSRLIRRSLDFSRTQKITLKEEIDFLRSYLEIEKIRLNNNLDYSIDTDGTTQVEETYVFPMMLQPIVENSLVHGFVDHSKALKLIIKFSSDANYLKCEVIDNGVGRAHSVKKTKSYKSWSSKILEEKMLILNKIKSNTISINIEDIPATHEFGHGTHVTILLRQ